MRVVLTTVNHASVTINQKVVGQINRGYLLLVGFTEGDNKTIVEKMVDKILSLRVFRTLERRSATYRTNNRRQLCLLNRRGNGTCQKAKANKSNAHYSSTFRVSSIMTRKIFLIDSGESGPFVMVETFSKTASSLLASKTGSPCSFLIFPISVA